MKKEFEDILEKHGYTFYKDGILTDTYLCKIDFEELMEEVWNLAIEAAADNAEADVNWLDEHCHNLTCGEEYEVYVIKNSILKLKL